MTELSIIIRLIGEGNICFFITIIGLIIVTKINNNIDKKYIRKFILLEILLLISAITTIIEHNINIHNALFTNIEIIPNGDILRTILSTIAYILRPFFAYGILIFLVKDRTVRHLLSIPFIVNAIIYMSSHHTRITFFIVDNEYCTGPLYLSGLFVSIFYMILIIYYSILNFIKFDIESSIIILFSVFACSFGAISEIIFTGWSMLYFCCAVSYSFYLMFLNTQGAKNDTLTNLRNGKTFANDCIKYDLRITAIISIDVNGLKDINDKNGHLEGNKALKTIANCIDKLCGRKCQGYRIGGDEFEIICFNINKQDIIKLIDKMQSKISKAGYSVSIGYAIRDNNTVKSLIDIADTQMYNEKSNFYKTKSM